MQCVTTCPDFGNTRLRATVRWNVFSASPTHTVSLTTRSMYILKPARSGAFGWGTELQAGRSRVPSPTALGLTQPLTEMSTWDISWWVKVASAEGWPHILHVPIVLKSGSVNLLEPSGPVQACTRIALPYLYLYIYLCLTRLITPKILRVSSDYCSWRGTHKLHFLLTKLNSVVLVRERTIPTERPPPVGEVSANFCG